jgi:SAM-dependent methyltransferase
MTDRQREAFSPISFRDPAGRLFDDGQRILRVVSPAAVPTLKRLLDAPWQQKAVAAGRLIPTAVVSATEWPDLAVPSGGMVVEHPRLLASFAHEWPAEMLHAAAELTLDLLAQGLSAGLGLKDATPANVLFHGTTPTFIDVLSFEDRHPNDPQWQAYGQFTRMFLLPLLASRETGLPMAACYAGSGDGLSPEAVYELLGGWRRLMPPALGLVALPTWLARRADRMSETLYEPSRVDPPQKARYILDHLLRHLRRSLDQVQPRTRAGIWTGYMQDGRASSYDADGFADKEATIAEWLRRLSPRQVLDVGCNTGHFSLLAASLGAAVTAIDADPAAVTRTWQAARQAGARVLPLVVDICRPTPAWGWRNAESPDFLSRARGRFDHVMLLAVVHHLVLTAGIPISEVLGLVADLTTDTAIVEWVPPTDPMAKVLIRGRTHLESLLTLDSFETACRSAFEVLAKQPVGPHGRILFLLRKRHAAPMA